MSLKIISGGQTCVDRSSLDAACVYEPVSSYRYKTVATLGV